jgi:hypothetical protein
MPMVTEVDFQRSLLEVDLPHVDLEPDLRAGEHELFVQPHVVLVRGLTL